MFPAAVHRGGSVSATPLAVFLPSDMSEGAVGDMAELGVTESFQVKRQVLLSASEAAEMILRVDDVIKAAPRSVSPPQSLGCNQQLGG